MTGPNEAVGVGRASGSGFYDYASGAPVPDEAAHVMIAAIEERLGVPRREFTDEEIQRRLAAAMVHEGRKVLDEGVAPVTLTLSG